MQIAKLSAAERERAQRLRGSMRMAMERCHELRFKNAMLMASSVLCEALRAQQQQTKEEESIGNRVLLPAPWLRGVGNKSLLRASLGRG